MRNRILIRLLMATALLILAFPAVAGAQYANRDRRDIRDAITHLDNSSARLESDLRVTPGRRVFGFRAGVIDTPALAQVRDLRIAVGQFKHASDDGRDLRGSYDEARLLVDRGTQLDRYLRLRTGKTTVDADLSEIRSSLHLIAEVYNLKVSY